MAGAATPELAAAVSNAGGLGGLGCGGTDSAGMREQVRAARLLGARRLNVNFFLHEAPVRSRDRESAAVAALAPLAARVGVEPPSTIAAPFDRFSDDTLRSVIGERPEVVTFHFGSPPPAVVAELQAAGILVGATATTVSEAQTIESASCDFLIAQGAEAGGHRGTFRPPFEPASIGTIALVSQVVDAVSIPVIAAGGIADGRGVAAVIMLGASSAQLGSAFLSSPEAAISSAHRRALAERSSEDTVMTMAISGRPARAFRNLLTEERAQSRLADFPVQFSVSQPIRSASSAECETEAMWAGRAFPLNRAEGAAAVMDRIGQEAEMLLDR